MTICSETTQLKDTVLHLLAASGTTDQTNYGNDGSYQGGMGTAEGTQGLEYVFDGSDDYIDTPDDSDASTAGVLTFEDTDGFTLSVWYKGTDTDANGDLGKVLIGRDNGDIGANFILRSGYAEYLHYNSGWYHTIVSSTLVADGAWHHICYVNHTDETGDLYIDGVAEIEGVSSSISIARKMTCNHIGRGYNGQYTSGSLKDIRIISRAITVTEIRELYNATARPTLDNEVLKLQPATGLVDQSAAGQANAVENGTGQIQVGRRFEFNGTDDYLSVPTSANSMTQTCRYRSG